MPDFDAVLFDMDGVLVDSEPLHARAWADAMRAFEHGIPDAWFLEWIGFPDDELALELYEAYCLGESVVDLLNRKREVFRHLVATELTAFAGVEAGVRSLVAAEIPLAVVTSTERSQADEMLLRVGLLNSFSIIVTSDDVTHRKPDPEPYLTAARWLRTDPERCVVLEDSSAGLTAACRAGCTVARIGPTVPDLDPLAFNFTFTTTAEALAWLTDRLKIGAMPATTEEVSRPANSGGSG